MAAQLQLIAPPSNIPASHLALIPATSQIRSLACRQAIFHSKFVAPSSNLPNQVVSMSSSGFLLKMLI
jgi:hypothetical protein